MRAFSSVWSLWSRDEDGGNTIQSATAKTKLHGSLSCRIRVIADQKFYTAAIGIFDVWCSCDLDLDLMTFTYEVDLYAWRYVKAFKIYHLTDRHTHTHIQTDRHD